jgi:hypothetical protein
LLKIVVFQSSHLLVDNTLTIVDHLLTGSKLNSSQETHGTSVAELERRTIM